MNTSIGFVVLYLNDTIKGAEFWTTMFGFEVKKEVDANGHKVITVGAKDGQTNFELVPLALMANNPDNLNLATPSIGLLTDDLSTEHGRLKQLGADVFEISNHGGIESFAVLDYEQNAFAIIQR